MAHIKTSCQHATFKPETCPDLSGERVDYSARRQEKSLWGTLISNISLRYQRAGRHVTLGERPRWPIVNIQREPSLDITLAYSAAPFDVPSHGPLYISIPFNTHGCKCTFTAAGPSAGRADTIN